MPNPTTVAAVTAAPVVLPAFVETVLGIDEAVRRRCTASPDTRIGPLAMAGRYAIKRHVLFPAFAAAWWIGHRQDRPRLRRAGALGFTGVLATMAAVDAVKAVLPRGRPDECGDARQWCGGPTARSFPSGHTGSAFAAATAVAVTAADPLVAATVMGCAAALASGRVLRDRHWTSDVVAGAVIGTVTTALVALWMDRGAGA